MLRAKGDTSEEEKLDRILSYKLLYNLYQPLSRASRIQMFEKKGSRQ